VIFRPTRLTGLWVIELERIEDERGFFARSFCREEFERHGLASRVEQCNVSFNRRRGTLRGLHYQAPPHEEDKLVRCTQGAIWDVAVDLRPDSPTYRRWAGETLTAANRAMLFIPKGFAHGFVTLEDETEVFYQMSEPYHPECARGFRYDDPAFAIDWPLAPAVVSEHDLGRPPFEDAG
jgi:dTDP-4-dehydrorhamnose 3,5-epimerase